MRLTIYIFHYLYKQFESLSDFSIHPQICCANSRQITQKPVWGNQGANPPTPTTPKERSKLLPTVPNCGDNFGNRIVGGETTLKKEFPWLALIAYTKRKCS